MNWIRHIVASLLVAAVAGFIASGFGGTEALWIAALLFGGGYFAVEHPR